MIVYLFFCFLAVPATDILYSANSYGQLEGIWYDLRENVFVEIRLGRRILQVREIRSNGRAKAWREYNDMGRGFFDDCRGSVIIYIDPQTIKWKRKNRSISVLHKERRARNSSLSRITRGFSLNDYLGDWYCASDRLSLRIEVFGRGFRARQPLGPWIYYFRFGENDFRDDRGNRYYFDEFGLNWRSHDNRRTYSFLPSG